MVDVLLTHSNHLYNDRKQVRKMQPYPPLQTLLAAACLRREGYRVALVRPGARIAGDRVRAGAGAPSAAPGCRVRGQFQFPDQDVSAAQSRVGRLDGAHRAPRRSAGHRQRLRRFRPRRRIPGGGLLLRPGRRGGRRHRRSRPLAALRQCPGRRTRSSRHRLSRSRIRRCPAHAAPRAHRRPGFAAHAGMGSD